MSRNYENLHLELSFEELSKQKEQPFISSDDMLNFDSILELNIVYRIEKNPFHLITRRIKYGMEMYGAFSLACHDGKNLNSFICKLTIKEFLEEYSNFDDQLKRLLQENKS